MSFHLGTSVIAVFELIFVEPTSLPELPLFIFRALNVIAYL